MLSPTARAGTIVGVVTPSNPPLRAGTTGPWAVIIPVKELSIAKSRLVPPIGIDRAELAMAMARDVITAAVTCDAVGRVMVVTNDPRAASAALELGAVVVEDLPDSGLNPALEHAAGMLRHDGWDAVAAVSSDLPAMRSDELAFALGCVAPASRGVVADADGRGTVLLAAREVGLSPCFGSRSFELHVGNGAWDLSPRMAEPSGLRQDVDTAEDLAAARRIGLGTNTSVALAKSRPAATVRS